MNKDFDPNKFIASFDRKIQELKELCLDVVHEEMDKEVPIGMEEFGQYQAKWIEDTFRQAVGTFYSSYDPGDYKRKYGLYEVLDLKYNENGTVKFTEPGYDDLYDGSKMHANRSGGNNLFNDVFIEGYHGGARSINANAAKIWGQHPNPGVPYYRKHGFVKLPGSKKRKFIKYGLWGSPAIPTDSPYSLIADEIDRAAGGEIFEEFKRIMDKHAEKWIKASQKRIQKIVSELFD